MTEDARRSAPATARNRDPILAVLRLVLPRAGRVLEVASGTGEHVVFFAQALPDVVWQPSDPDLVSRRSTAAWVAAEGVRNVLPPLDLDASAPAWPVEEADAVLCVNMIHIAPWEAALGLLAGSGRVLPVEGPLILYGPFMRGGRHTAPSNESFDRWLRAHDPRWGVRDLDAVAVAAEREGLRLDDVVEMPANNLIVIFRRSFKAEGSERRSSRSRGPSPGGPVR